MNGVLVHNSALLSYTELGTFLANETNFHITHTPVAGSIPCPIKLQFRPTTTVLRLPPLNNMNQIHKSKWEQQTILTCASQWPMRQYVYRVAPRASPTDSRSFSFGTFWLNNP